MRAVFEPYLDPPPHHAAVGDLWAEWSNALGESDAEAVVGRGGCSVNDERKSLPGVRVNRSGRRFWVGRHRNPDIGLVVHEPGPSGAWVTLFAVDSDDPERELPSDKLTSRDVWLSRPSVDEAARAVAAFLDWHRRNRLSQGTDLASPPPRRLDTSCWSCHGSVPFTGADTCRSCGWRVCPGCGKCKGSTCLGRVQGRTCRAYRPDPLDPCGKCGNHALVDPPCPGSPSREGPR